MSRLFIELYLDEDVSVLAATLIRARGFVATTTVGEGQLGSADAAQLAYAFAHQRTLLTHNRADFDALAQTYYAAGKTHYGIIIARRYSVYELVRRILVMLNQVSADEIRNQVRYI
jgi:hypothetical protein